MMGIGRAPILINTPKSISQSVDLSKSKTKTKGLLSSTDESEDVDTDAEDAGFNCFYCLSADCD